jgi:hypothetical protein
VVTILWGSGHLRFPLMTLEWPEEERKIEGKARVKLEDEYGLKLDAPPPIIGDATDTATTPGAPRR